MSFILDALKKSEAERQRQAGPALLEMRVMRPRRRIPLWVWIVGGVLIAGNAVLITMFALRDPAPEAVAAAPNAVTPAPAPAPAANATPSTAPPTVMVPGPSALPMQPPAYATPAPSDERFDMEAAAENPADFEPAQSGGATVASQRVTGEIRNYNEVDGNMPQMRLDLHVYAARPAERYAFINMRRVKEGDITAEGARVMEITREGVVLNYRSTEFLLGRE